MTVTRSPRTGGERELLLGALREQRQLVHWKLDGASDDVLRRVVMPSGLHAPGVVSHLTEVERWWVRDVLAGEDGLRYSSSDDDPDGEFHVDAPVEQLLAAYEAECALADSVLARTELDAMAVRKPFTARWIVVHLVEETARHLGQLDLLRELADGATGYVPPDAG